MSTPTRLIGNNGQVTNVTEGNAHVTKDPAPPKIEGDVRIVPFSTFLTIDGAGVDKSLNKDGSTTPIDALLLAGDDYDTYISTANILVADSAGVQLNRFGAIAGGLTTGLSLFVEYGTGREIIADELKTNFDLIRIATLTRGTGSKTDAYQIANTNPSNEDGYNPVIDFYRFSSQGVMLRAGTRDSLGVTINDDLTSVSTFNILINGYKRLLVD